MPSRADIRNAYPFHAQPRAATPTRPAFRYVPRKRPSLARRILAAIFGR